MKKQFEVGDRVVARYDSSQRGRITKIEGNHIFIGDTAFLSDGVMNTIEWERRQMVAEILNMVMSDYRQVVEEDSISDMMEFMDDTDYPYNHTLGIGLSDGEENDSIRNNYKYAYRDWVHNHVLQSVQSNVKDEIFS